MFLIFLSGTCIQDARPAVGDLGQDHLKGGLVLKNDEVGLVLQNIVLEEVADIDCFLLY